ncbi:MAG: hypothetical protein H5T62_18240 [Anaerolineae bacterium]|nr:hypothetical protein [Anaerolineae bacterium]
MTILGISPMPQPENVFTIAEYRVLIERYEQIFEEKLTLFKQGDKLGLSLEQQRARNAFLWEQARSLSTEYYARLPIYLLARCPICGGRVWEAIDTFSLNGPGWISGPTGFGWSGSGQQSYQSECEHVQIVAYCVNLNGLEPDDIFITTHNRWVNLGPEVPYVMRSPLSLDETYVVIHALPVGRYDDAEPQPRYTVYFTTYFTIHKQEFDNVIRSLRIHHARITPMDADYNLVKWVKAGKLFWLDSDDPELPLRNRPVEVFPYANVQGDPDPWRRIVNGRVDTLASPRGCLRRGGANSC